MKAIIFTGIASIFFYVLCWFTNQPTKTVHYIGICLPWLSLVISIPFAYIFKYKADDYFSASGYVYAITTIIYLVAVSIMSASIWQQLPHLATCVSLIAYFSLESAKKKRRN